MVSNSHTSTRAHVPPTTFNRFSGGAECGRRAPHGALRGSARSCSRKPRRRGRRSPRAGAPAAADARSAAQQLGMTDPSRGCPQGARCGPGAMMQSAIIRVRLHHDDRVGLSSQAPFPTTLFRRRLAQQAARRRSARPQPCVPGAGPPSPRAGLPWLLPHKGTRLEHRTAARSARTTQNNARDTHSRAEARAPRMRGARAPPAARRPPPPAAAAAHPQRTARQGGVEQRRPETRPCLRRKHA